MIEASEQVAELHRLLKLQEERAEILQEQADSLEEKAGNLEVSP